jgi:hypothetical protein
MKIYPVGAELFQAYGWTDRRTYMTNIMVGFGNFSNAPKKSTRGLREREKGVWYGVRKEMERSNEERLG